MARVSALILPVCVVLAGLAGACGDAPVAPLPNPTAPTGTPPLPSAAQGCGVTSVGFTPLSDLAGGAYRDQPGGLYPGRSNSHPDQAAGLALARAIQPRNAAGAPDPNGKYALVSIGTSNTNRPERLVLRYRIQAGRSPVSSQLMSDIGTSPAARNSSMNPRKV